MLLLRNSLYLIAAFLLVFQFFNLLKFGKELKEEFKKKRLESSNAIYMLNRYLKFTIPLVVIAFILYIVAAFIDGFFIH